MRRFLWSALLCIPLAFLSAAEAQSPSAFFNGKDFNGWEGLEQYWSVKDGALIGMHKGLKFNTFLCSKRKYANFELKFQVKLTGGGANSGVQVRSKIINDKTFAVGGPQCDMGDNYWASLYGEHYSPDQGIAASVAGGMMKAADAKVVKRVLKAGEFNDYYIKCVGEHVTIKLNGEITVDAGFPKMPRDGIIAWQLHAGGPMEVVFRNIRFKELSAPK
jgi:hypothetical protein